MPEEEVNARRRALARWCGAVVGARWFAVAVFTLILVNAALLGVETYSGLAAAWHHWLRLAEHVCLAAFTAEILLRLGAHADRPRDFLRDPWNVFDLAVVLCAFLPVVRENTTVLRLLRLARVLRTARFLPQLRIVLLAVVRSLPGTLSFLLVGALLLYMYAMVGWVFFGRHDPEHYGSIGRAALTLFLLMTLDGIGDAVHAGLDISRWSLLYYASYVLLASFVLVNVLIGVVITSLDEARELDRRQPPDGAPPPGPRTAEHPLLLRVETVRRALDDLEHDLARSAAGAPPTGGASAPPTAAAVPVPRPAAPDGTRTVRPYGTTVSPAVPVRQPPAPGT
ncbi:ion transporter [Streptomyces olivaceus]|uniref:ion transporter n=1 Tax=Streptomyces olivaceus TaxID=47716 RepID=UPI0018A7ECED|nr:ion transporter [Streptomyces olivaceus]MBF8169722.1 ion transporter [Streptomyces olivaceus]